LSSAVFYSHPRYYDVAFGWDPGAETDFLEACFRRHAPKEVTSVLDVACGTGRFSLEFARRGRTVAGLDISREMIDYLGKKAVLEGLPVEVFVRDMRDFQLPRRDFDAAICMTDSFTYLVDVQAITAHLRAVARHLVPQGLYIVDFGTVVDPARPFGEPERWEMARDDLQVVFTGNIWEDYDPVAQTATEVLRFEVTEHGQSQVIEQRATKRVLYPQEFLALLEASRVFRLAAWFQGFSLDRPFDVPPYHRRLIAVLRRVADVPSPEQVRPRAETRERDRRGKRPRLKASPSPPRLPAPLDDNAIEEYWARGPDEPWRPPQRPETTASAEPAPAARRRRRRRKKRSTATEPGGS